VLQTIGWGLPLWISIMCWRLILNWNLPSSRLAIVVIHQTFRVICVFFKPRIHSRIKISINMFLQSKIMIWRLSVAAKSSYRQKKFRLGIRPARYKILGTGPSTRSPNPPPPKAKGLNITLEKYYIWYMDPTVTCLSSLQ